MGKLTAGVVGGLALGAFLVPLLGIVAAQLSVSVEKYIGFVYLLIIVTSAALALRASRTARAWRFMLIAAGCAALLLSFWHLSSSGHGSESNPDVHIGAAGVISFFFGIVLLLVGFLLGREELT